MEAEEVESLVSEMCKNPEVPRSTANIFLILQFVSRKLKDIEERLDAIEEKAGGR